MSRDPRDWQADVELVHTVRYEYKLDHLNDVLDSLFYWLQYAEKWKVPYEVTWKLLERSRERKVYVLKVMKKPEETIEYNI